MGRIQRRYQKGLTWEGKVTNELRKYVRRQPTGQLKLPDHVIHHILSFIPTINVVRMSLLSRRWRRMWCSIPTLELSDDDIENEFSFNFVEQCLKNHKMGTQHDTNSVVTRKSEMEGENFPREIVLRRMRQLEESSNFELESQVVECMCAMGDNPSGSYKSSFF
ncbi:Putative F-box/LRR-repeat protein [Morus notabilis]|uniref:Putative F-box/LRR-repeat protein n=1 Tax=Morus notabilis TaxID=981085 RepID=W9QP85_9ROSA|nr:Putative F-box/LRR-repeat protein [Morus notabilis]